MIVAIDGPAGTGKGTVTKIIANDLNLVNIDTGATYRAVALEVLKRGLKLTEKDEIIKLSAEIDVVIDEDGKTFLNGQDVTKEIRSKAVSEIVSQVSSIKEVRLNMVEVQRKLAKRKRRYNGRKRYHNICIS